MNERINMEEPEDYVYEDASSDVGKERVVLAKRIRGLRDAMGIEIRGEIRKEKIGRIGEGLRLANQEFNKLV